MGISMVVEVVGVVISPPPLISVHVLVVILFLPSQPVGLV